MEGEDKMVAINQGSMARTAATSVATAVSSVNSINSVSTMNVLHRTTTLGNTAVSVSPKFVPTLSEDEAVGQSRLLKALADPTRLGILTLLSRHEGEVCVFQIVESFILAQPTI